MSFFFACVLCFVRRLWILVIVLSSVYYLAIALVYLDVGKREKVEENRVMGVYNCFCVVIEK